MKLPESVPARAATSPYNGLCIEPIRQLAIIRRAIAVIELRTQMNQAQTTSAEKPNDAQGLEERIVPTVKCRPFARPCEIRFAVLR
eukprot:6186140-Pleurochrysis_carterae.AAC.2